MYLSYLKHIHLTASCSNQEYIAFALRNDLCLKTSVACFFFLLRLLSLPSESWPSVKVQSHSPTCLSVLGNCTNGLVEAQPDCLPSWPLHPLRHPQDVHRGPWQHIYFFTFLKPSAHLNSFLISVPRFSETIVTVKANFPASFLEKDIWNKIMLKKLLISWWPKKQNTWNILSVEGHKGVGPA